MARSLTGTLLRGVRNASPVPLVSRRTTYGSGMLSALTGGSGDGLQGQMAAMGGNGVLFAIVSRIAQTTSAVHWHLYTKAKTGKPEDRTEVTRHLALDVWNKPNPFMTGQEFREVFVQHLELTGETPWVVGRNPRASIPLELWPIRPDRMSPVPHPTKYLSGWVYSSPDGEQVPLAVDEVIFLRTPNPLDLYRGMSPVQAVMTDVDSLKYSREWNRNFFLNSAEPGGIIQIEKRLDDTEFDEMNARWREQHQGIARAHRVALLENGAKWVDRKITQKDMEFTSLAGLSVEQIRMAFAFPKPMLGSVDNVNLANAKAAQVDMARNVTVPRLERIKGALNSDFLPLFGPAAEGLEFDYDSPVPEDQDAENAERDSRVKAYISLTGAGVKPASASEYLDLPEFEHDPKPEPVAPVVPLPVPDPNADPAADPAGLGAAMHRHPSGLRLAADPRYVDPDDLPDPAGSQAAWEAALAAVMVSWTAQIAALKARLVAAVRVFVESGDRAGLARIVADATELGQSLATALTSHAATGAGQVVAEAAAQGVHLSAGIADAQTLADMADAAAVLAARDLESSAAREALRVWGPGASADDVAAAVEGHLAGLTDAGPTRVAGAALTQAEGHGRVATLRHGPVGAIYADESRDDPNRCGPCAAINGRWLGNTDDLAQVFATHPNGSQYIGCLGRDRCRGKVTGVWRKGVGQ